MTPTQDTNPEIATLRRRFATRFNVRDGGRYADDWASRIDDVLAALDSLEARLRAAETAIREALYFVDAAVDYLGYEPFKDDEQWAAFIEEYGNAAAYLMSARSALAPPDPPEPEEGT